ncbi:PP2C family protein-serine/threonine phosphatase, partial [Thermodesulfobacteriota bacterium]
HNPAEALAVQAIGLTNNYIEKNHGGLGMFATVFFGALDTDSGVLSYINAGHEPPFVIGRTGVKCHLKPTGPAVGLMPDVRFHLGRVELEIGDIMVGFTDGVTEACASNGDFFSKDRLLSLIDQPASSASDLLERIKTNLKDFIGDTPQSDDITLLSIQRKA